nr:uncharacterized protein LOC116779557 [Danaus plexippus plexippus]
MLRTYMFLLTFITSKSESSSSSSSSSELAKAFSFLNPISGSSETSETNQELNNYHKWIFKQQQKEVIDKYKQEQSKEEKDQLQYFEDILKKVKEFGNSGRRNLIIII